MKRTIQSDKLPKHVAIIMDGNGRWAKKRLLPRIEGHRRGANIIPKIVDHAINKGIQYLTVYAFSTENWNRTTIEVNALMKLFSYFLKKHIALLLKNKIRLRIIGDIEPLNPCLKKYLMEALDATKHFKGKNFVIALNYGARAELLHAVKKYAEDVKNGEIKNEKLDWDHFSKYLYTADIPDPDLIIRTSGEVRTSNFLLMQGAYSEMYFTDTHWPDFNEEEFDRAIEDYQKRERRFGKTGEEVKSHDEA